MKIKYQFHIFLFFLLITISETLGQIYPVNVNTLVKSPYSNSLYDYASPAYERISAHIFTADLNRNNYPVKIRLVIRGEGGLEISTKLGSEVGPFYLNGGTITTLSNVDLYKLFLPENLNFLGMNSSLIKNKGLLPEGIYNFNFEVLDFNRNIIISSAYQGFATVWLMLNDPPLINKPLDKSIIEPTNPQNILFSWTPRHMGSPNSAYNTLYEMQIVELNPSYRNPNDAFLTSPTIFEKEIATTSYNYTIQDPTLQIGKWYAFRIRAKTADNKDYFKNNGYSEVFSFYYGYPCKEPINIKSTYIDDNTVLYTWDKLDNHLSYNILTKEEVKNKYISYSYYKNSSVTENKFLKTKNKYSQNFEIKVAAKCSNLISNFVTARYVPSTSSTSCTPPLKYTINKTKNKNDKDVVEISWDKNSSVKSYILSLVSSTNEKKTIETTENKTIFEGFGDGSSLVLPTKFDLSIGVKCNDGSLITGTNKTIDLSSGNVSTSVCPTPKNEKIVTTVVEKTNLQVSWENSYKYKSFIFRYKILNTDDYYTEIKADKPSVKIENIKFDINYQYQILYVCDDETKKTGEFQTFNIKSLVASDSATKTGSCYSPTDITYEITSKLTADIRWKEADGVNKYLVNWRSVGAEKWNIETTGSNRIILENLVGEASYEFFVTSVCKSGGNSKPSETYSFKTEKPKFDNTVCNAPMIKPTKIATSTEAAISWTGEANHSKYGVEYKTEKSSTWTTLETTDVRYAQEISNLNSDMKYVARVKAFCGTNTSTYSLVDTFLIPKDFDKLKDCNSKYSSSNLSQIPIEKLNKGDKIQAADFTFEIKDFETERPYKGNAIVKIPYLKHSSILFGMEGAFVNENKELYKGYLYFKKVDIQFIDPKLSAQISGFVTKLDDGLSKASTMLVLADSIQDALNDMVGAVSEPMDWKKYEGWTAKQLFDEAKRLFGLAQDLIKTGSPQSVAQARNMMMEAVEILRSAASLGNQTVKNLSEYGKKIKDWLGPMLEKMKKKADTEKTTLNNTMTTADPLMVSDYNSLQDEGIDSYTISPSEFSIVKVNATPVLADTVYRTSLKSNSRVKDIHEKYSEYRRNEYKLEKIKILLNYIEFYKKEANAQKLSSDLETNLNHLLKGKKIQNMSEAELTTLQGQIEVELEKYISKEAIDDIASGKLSETNSEEKTEK